MSAHEPTTTTNNTLTQSLPSLPSLSNALPSLTVSGNKHSTVTPSSTPTHRSTHIPHAANPASSTLSVLDRASRDPLNASSSAPVTGAATSSPLTYMPNVNYAGDSPAVRSSSLADLVHRIEPQSSHHHPHPRSPHTPHMTHVPHAPHATTHIPHSHAQEQPSHLSPRKQHHSTPQAPTHQTLDHIPSVAVATDAAVASTAHPSHHTRTPPLTRADSEGGSQQERNHQRPDPRFNKAPRLPPPSHNSRNSRHHLADTSPKQPSRKRRLSEPIAPDLASLTPKPVDDLASSVVPPPLPVAGDHRFSHGSAALGDDDDDAIRRFNSVPDRIDEGNPVLDAADSSRHRRHGPVTAASRAHLLEENRALRIELDTARFQLRQMRSSFKRIRRDAAHSASLLTKYRSQLISLFERGVEGTVRVDADKMKVSAALRAERRHRYRSDKSVPKPDADSISNSRDEATDNRDADNWSCYSNDDADDGDGEENDEDQGVDEDELDDEIDVDDASHRYDGDRSEATPGADRDGAAHSDATNRKRTRAPAWTAEEESIFMDAYSKYGCQWKMFQDALPGRSRRQIQSHGSYLIRQGKLTKKNSRPWQRRKPLSSIPNSFMGDPDADMDIGDSDNE